MPRLAGKVALITGAGSGIGRACALLFAREGAQVALLGRRREPLEGVAKEVASQGGTPAACLTADVGRAADVDRAFAELAQRFGKLHAVVNNAGAVQAGTVETISEEDWDRLMTVNLKGTYLVSRAALKELRRAGGGSIINIGSALGLVGLKNRAAYCAAKGGVTLLTKAMALDHAHENIRVNCICPTIVETEMFAGVMAQYPDPEAERRRRTELIPLGRPGRPEDIAQLAVYLASDESSWMTGAALPLDGGVTAY
jgi:NAD(P)-dependent dehydrogenase (short-subunit alcohol dehydrogenase family)